MLRSRILCAAVAVMTTAFPAFSLTLECNMKKTNAGGGYVTDLYVFQYDEGSDSALVADGLIYYFNDNKPLTARVSDDTASKIVFSWSVMITNSTGQTANMQYRASYLKGDKSVIVRGAPGGDFSNNFEARGKCKSV